MVAKRWEEAGSTKHENTRGGKTKSYTSISKSVTASSFGGAESRCAGLRTESFLKERGGDSGGGRFAEQGMISDTTLEGRKGW